MAVLRTLRVLLRHDRGVSLPELLIVMMLSALVLTMAGTMFVNVAKATTQANGLRASTAEAGNMMAVLSTDVRAATQVPGTGTELIPAVQAGRSDQITLITYTDAGPSFDAPFQIRYRIDGGRLVQDRWNPTQTYPVSSGVAATRVVGEKLTQSALFRYYSANGTELVPGTGGLTLDQRKQVTSIDIRISVRAPGSQEIVEVRNTVGMPNMGVSRSDV